MSKPLEDSWVQIAKIDQIPPGTARNLGGVTIFHQGGVIMATETRCPHMGHPMSKGIVRDGVVTCAWHKWEFDLATGGCYRGACDDLVVYPVRVVDGAIFIDRTSRSQQMGHEARRLQESMMVGDIYLQAKAIARLVGAGVGIREICRIAAEQAFRHSQIAHQSLQAATELQAIMDAGTLAGILGEDACTPMLLSGIRLAGGGSGDRPAVVPLPGVLERRLLRERLELYVRESSPLGIERLLTSAHDVDCGDDLLDLATRSWTVVQRELVVGIATCLQARRWFGEDSHGRCAAIAGWILGAGRGAPEPDAREAMAWMEVHEAALSNPDLGRGSAPLASGDLEALSAPDRVGDAFDLLLQRLSQGVGTEQVLDAISLICARRFAQLRPGNGGLWDSAGAGLRSCHALRQAMAHHQGRFRCQALFGLVFHLQQTRWLPAGSPWKAAEVLKDATWEFFSKAIAAGDHSQARSAVVSLVGHAADRSTQAAHWLAPLVEDDMGAAQLSLFLAVASESVRQTEWQPYLAGLVTYAIDMKQARDIQAAARFGTSFVRPAV